MTVHNKNCKNHYYDGEEIIAVKIGGFCIDQRTTYLPAAGGWNSTYTFSGKEKDKESGYSYFGARYYNADLSIWLSVDPRAGSYPAVTPYNYCANSPVMYRDPNGKFVLTSAAVSAIIIGTVAGAFIGNSVGATGGQLALYVFGGAIIGGLSSGIGASIAASIGGVLGNTGFVSGLLTNGVSAAVSTSISSTAMSWLGGNSFGEGLLKGFIDGQIAGAISGLIGGIAGGRQAYSDGFDFWTGAGNEDVLASISSEGITPKVGKGMEYSTEYAKKFSQDNIYFAKNVKGLGELRADGSTPFGYSSKEGIVTNPKGEEVWGTAVHKGLGRGTDVYLYKGAFTSKERLYFTMVHEYLHVSYNAANLFIGMNDKHHNAIAQWQYDQANIWKFDIEGYTNYLNKYSGSYSAKLLPDKFGVTHPSVRPWLVP